MKSTSSMCSSSRTWLELASGLFAEQEASALVSHAAHCTECAAALREALDLMQPDDEEVTEEIPQHLASSTPEWQRALASRLHAEASPPSASISGPKPRAVIKWRWRSVLTARVALPLTAAFTAMLALTVTLHFRSNSYKLFRTNQLLAEAYTKQRTLDLRMHDASYGPLQITRGAGDARTARPLQLLEAETRIATEQVHRQNDPQWLLTAARADLLEGDFDHAIRLLRQAESSTPQPPEVALDLATAYFEHAKQEASSAPEFGLAIEKINEFIRKHPDDPVATFNRALIYQRLQLYSQAILDWQHYLQLDPKGAWADEARDHLDEARRLIEYKQKASDDRALQSPRSIAAGMAPEIILDARIEDYQRKVFTEWYPALLKITAGKAEGSAPLVVALRRIAVDSAEQHGDQLIKRFVNEGVGGIRLIHATEDLAASISANESGDAQHALELASRSRQEFRRQGNIAGALRSEFEIVYAMQFSSRTASCVLAAAKLQRAAMKEQFLWLAAQAGIEGGFCANMNGDLASAIENLNRATKLAQAARYEEASNRALLGDAAMQMQAGSDLTAWQLALHGLRSFWSSPAPNQRGESLYDLLELMAEQKGEWYLQHALLLECLSLLDRDQNHLAAARVLMRLSGNELILQQTNEASASMERALQMFQTAPQTPSTVSQELIVLINLAKAQALSHDVSGSVARLEPFKSSVASLHENLSTLDFYSTLGEGYRKLGRLQEAERADTAGIAVFRSSLSTLTQPRDRLAWYRQISATYRSLVQLRLDQRDPVGAAKTWQQYRSAMLPGSAGSPDVGEPKNLLIASADQTTLVYANLPDGPFAWAVSGREVKTVRLDGSYASLAAMGDSFSLQCSTRTTPIAELQTNGRKLFHLLIEPFMTSLPVGRKIIIEPDEELALIPFSALIDSRGRYLNEEHDLVLSPPSASPALRSSVVAAISKHDRVLLVESRSAMGNMRTEDSLAHSEIDVLATMFPHATLFAAESNVKAQLGRRLSYAAVFHYAGHSGTTAMGGALTLPERGDDGRQELVALRPGDIRPVWLTHCKLAVLSACQTNRGEGGHWLDRENLAITLLNSGVPQVVASRWDVDSACTAALMKAFYTHVLMGASTTESLRDASEQLRVTPGYEHPYFWAAFSVLQSSPTS